VEGCGCVALSAAGGSEAEERQDGSGEACFDHRKIVSGSYLDRMWGVAFEKDFMRSRWSLFEMIFAVLVVTKLNGVLDCEQQLDERGACCSWSCSTKNCPQFARSAFHNPLDR
jgi:hypothetical protein